MARKKRLNIYNTDRKYNMNLKDKQEIANKLKVHALNEDEIEQEMDQLKEASRRIPLQNDTEYLVYQDKYQNDRLIEKLIEHGGQVSYYTTKVVPFWVIDSLSRKDNSEVIYTLREEFTPREIRNVFTAFKATTVVIDAPVVVPDTNPNQVLFALEKLKTGVDEVQLNFPPLHDEEVAERHKPYYEKQKDGLWYCTSEAKFQYAQHVQTSLSIWAMNLFITYDNETDRDNLNNFMERARDKRNPSRKKKRKQKRKQKEGQMNA